MPHSHGIRRLAAGHRLVDASESLLRDGTFIDLRAPVEYLRGALPGAVNLPLMSDAEREQVGTAYTRQGQAVAVDLGHRLVCGAHREARIAKWLEFARDHPYAHLYCARGGLRSEIVQTWLRERGLEIPRIRGGFKALRNLCLNVLETAPAAKPMLLISGYTGVGKTELIRTAPGSIDLEGLAHHRGSAFGARETPQPGQVGFENALAATYLRHAERGMVLEDESRNLGRIALPEIWFQQMRQAPVVLLEADMDSRCARIEREYVREPLAAGMPAERLREHLGECLLRIRRRLGGRRHAEVLRLLSEGFAQDRHAAWIEPLLSWYYDPMYEHQMGRKQVRVLGRGELGAVAALVEEFQAHPVG